MSLLQLIEVSRHFGEVKAVDTISFSVEQGQFLTLLGPSGCGKTTTLRLIAGFEMPDHGTIQFRGQTIASPQTATPPKDRQIGMVFQDYALFPHLNVAQNIAFGLKGNKTEKNARVVDMLDLVGLRGYEDRMTYELSGGQQQRVALARALAPQPAMLLLDEPFSNLDAALRAQVRSEIRAILRQANTACIFVTHSQTEALSLSDLVAVMFEGKVVQIAAPQALYECPVTPAVAAFVGEANWIEGQANGNFADCILGTMQLAAPANGRVKLLIRPEMLQLHPDSTGDQPTARVLWREYYGHDQRVGMALDDGLVLTARFDSTQAIQIGESIKLTVRGKVMAYPL